MDIYIYIYYISIIYIYDRLETFGASRNGIYPNHQNASSSTVGRNVDGPPPVEVGRNVTIFEQMLSLWPFWGLLRRVEVRVRNSGGGMMIRQSREAVCKQ